jgi:hypothetical protein
MSTKTVPKKCVGCGEAITPEQAALGWKVTVQIEGAGRRDPLSGRTCSFACIALALCNHAEAIENVEREVERNVSLQLAAALPARGGQA